MSPSERNPIIVRDRKELIFLLSEAATLEHMIMCQYLFASFSLKQDTNENVSPGELEAINGWNTTIVQVARQEMLHLSLANNLLTSLGAAPYFGRPNFPARSRYFPSHVGLALLPVDEVTLSYFLYLERPESMNIENVPGFSLEKLPVDPDAVVPVGQEFATVGQLYRTIEAGMRHLVETKGESRVFIGTTTGQATAEYFGWPELIPVHDIDTATRAVETIVTEGEGARGDWKNSHFGRFLGILNEYRELRKNKPQFEPSRPVLAAYSRPPTNVSGRVELIDDRYTSMVSDLFNASYEVLLQMLIRFFVQNDVTEQELRTLSASSILMMLNVIEPLGHFLTTLPVGPHRPGLTAGPVFEMYPTSHLLPHSKAASTILKERLVDLTSHCSQLTIGKEAGVLADVASSLEDLANRYGG